VCTNVLSLTFFPAWLERVEAVVAAATQSSISLATDNMADCERLMMQGQAQFMLCHHHPAAQTSLDSTYFRSVDVGDDMLVPLSLIQRELQSGELVRSAQTTDWDIPMQIRLYRPRARQSAAAEAFWTQVSRTAEAAPISDRAVISEP